jgi:RAT1-interacting protein
MLSVSKLVVGFRSPTGTLLEVREMETAKLPAIVKEEAMKRGSPPEWEREIAVGFLGGVMKWLKTIVVESGDEGGVWRIKRSDKSGIVECFRVGDGHGGILSERFIRWRQELKEIQRRKEMLGGMIDVDEEEESPQL